MGCMDLPPTVRTTERSAQQQQQQQQHLPRQPIDEEELDENDCHVSLMTPAAVFRILSLVAAYPLVILRMWVRSLLAFVYGNTVGIPDDTTVTVTKQSFRSRRDDRTNKSSLSSWASPRYSPKTFRKFCFIVLCGTVFHNIQCVAVDRPEVLTTTTPPVTATSKKTTFNHPFLVICTVDGNILVLNAHNGEVACVFSSGVPLVGPSEPLSEQDRRIVPGLDGMLYVSSDDGMLNPLAITVLDVLANPVKTCKTTSSSATGNHDDDDDEEEAEESTPPPSTTATTTTECGIVTATKSTSLFALDAFTGNLVWNQYPNGTTATTDSPASHTVLLQREDVLVQQINTDTGRSVWNVTLGTLQALEFGDSAVQGDLPPPSQGLLPAGGGGSSRAGRKNPLLDDYLEDLPHVMFSEDGTSLTAVDPTSNNGRRLWKQEFPTVVASVFGLNGRSWESLTVLEEDQEEAPGNDRKSNRRLLPESKAALTLYRPPYMPYFVPFDIDDPYFGMGRLFRYGGKGEHGRPPPLLEGASSTKRDDDTVKHSYFPHRLELPSPDYLESPKPRRDSIHYDGKGVYFSWPLLVAGVVCVLVAAIFVGRFVYKKKKKLWVKRATVSFDMNHLANHRSSSTGSINVDGNITATRSKKNAKLLLRSHSLPGNMDDHVDERSNRLNTSPGLIGTMTSGIPPTQSSPPPSNEEEPKLNGSPDVLGRPPLVKRSSTEVAQGVGLIDGTIPLIQYSRYASEFEELGALGKGGFGSVFQCRNALDGREYAIKKVHIRASSKLSQAEFSKRLQKTLREVKSLALLDHPNIVRYYTAWLELEQSDSDVAGGEHSEYAASDNYYLTSPTSTNRGKKKGEDAYEVSESSSSWRRGSRFSYDSASSSQHHGHSGTGIMGVPDALDDYGFVFDRSEENHFETETKNDSTTKSPRGAINSPVAETGQSSSKNDGSSSHNFRSHRGISFQTLESNADGSTSGWSQESRNQSNAAREENNAKGSIESGTNPPETPTSLKYILYIQMQFCSQKTLADFLSNEEARKGPSGNSTGVDIPYALSLFLQIGQGVKHVHSQGLIHRDLKPNNCFIDDSGAVKVGDFGLSRESSDPNNREEADTELKNPTVIDNSDITAGVGTRSYASPEQMKGGSEYDSSTDIYSLGIILFELCYPMYTGMERNIVLSNVRKHIFPNQWEETLCVEFPTLHSLLLSMISNNPDDRPTAHTVVQNIQSILEGFTISSLDKHGHEGAILLRVETMPREDGLRYTMDLIREAALPIQIDIVQYGLRGGSNKGQTKSIMEFAIVPKPCTVEGDENEYCPNRLGKSLVNRLNENSEVLLVRQVSATKYT